MKRSWFPILLIVALLSLLGLLAGLQYNWLGKISDDERERLQKRLEVDSQRFAEDFNREIQTAYFSFQLDAKIWRERNYAAFGERWDAWQKVAKFPALVESIYFVRDEELLRFDKNEKTFTTAQWTDELKNKKEELATDAFDTIDEKNLLLTMPIYVENASFTVGSGQIPRPISKPEKFGYLVIKLDRETIKNAIFPQLASKYFSDTANADFRLTVVIQKDASDVVYASQPTAEIAGQTADASVPLLNLMPDNLSVFVNRDLLTTIKNERLNPSELHVNQTIERKIETKNLENPKSSVSRVNVFRFTRNGSQNPRVLEQQREAEPGKWLLNVQHSDGSLENFIAKTRRKNLAVSFGILSLLGVSVVLIFVSAQRAKHLAQKQLDFVSAVSHEFRTPLAVIYSAGENLTDGVVNNEAQVARYGSLIKREGKKLSQMVEQILEFAGARSGRQKYDLREIDVGNLIDDALRECQPLIDEKGFTAEREIAENLPKITADATALGQAIQNLVVNSIKYGNGNQWLKISAENGDNRVKITIEDKGIGISKKEIAQIFQPFYRSKSVVNAQIHGNGLGLSLVKQTVEAHGGKISVESELKQGSKFTIYLPLNN